MSCILYTRTDGEITLERVKAADVSSLLKKGYASTPEQLEKFESVDTNGTGKLSDAEIKEAAKKAGIKIGRKSIKTLRKELEL